MGERGVSERAAGEAAAGRRFESKARRMYDSASVVVEPARVWPLRGRGRGCGGWQADVGQGGDVPAEHEQRTLVRTRDVRPTNNTKRVNPPSVPYHPRKTTLTPQGYA